MVGEPPDRRRSISGCLSPLGKVRRNFFSKLLPRFSGKLGDFNSIDLVGHPRSSVSIPAGAIPHWPTAGMVMEKLLDTKEAAPRIGVTAGTLENWRVRGIGP